MSNLTVTFDNEKFNLSSALIGGKIDDFVGNPTSLYCGHLDFDEIHSALYYSNRAVIKILVEQLGVPFSEVDDFLLSALSEAMTKEWNNLNSGESDTESRKIIKRKI
jgi:hypothetical protein